MAPRPHRRTSWWVTCPYCDKRTYFTRKDVRAARTHHEKRHGLSIYPCPHHEGGGDRFHVGLRPEGLGRGAIDRDTLADSQRMAFSEGRFAAGGAR